jgi:hypothetical protein
MELRLPDRACGAPQRERVHSFKSSAGATCRCPPGSISIPSPTDLNAFFAPIVRATINIRVVLLDAIQAPLSFSDNSDPVAHLWSVPLDLLDSSLHSTGMPNRRYDLARTNGVLFLGSYDSPYRCWIVDSMDVSRARENSSNFP